MGLRPLDPRLRSNGIPRDDGWASHGHPAQARGWTPVHDSYRAGDTLFGIYETEAAGKAGHTLGTFSGVDDIDAVVAELRKRGVVFEDYDLPGFKTVDGIAQFGPERVAWFRDPDGNTLSIDDARL